MKLDEVPFTLPARREMYGRLSPWRQHRRAVEDVLVGLGYFEVYTPSLVAEDPDPNAYRIPQPQSQDMALLRTTLLRASSRSPATTWTSETTASPSSRSHTSTARATRSCPTACTSQPRASPRSCEGRSRTDPRRRPGRRAFALSTRCCIPARRRRRPAGSSAGSGRGSWRATGARSSSTSAPSSREAGRTRTSSPIHRSSRTLPLRCPTKVLATDLVAAARAAVPELRSMEPFDVYRGEQVGEVASRPFPRRVPLARAHSHGRREAAGLREKIVAALRERFGAELRA